MRISLLDDKAYPTILTLPTTVRARVNVQIAALLFNDSAMLVETVFY